MKFLTYSPNQEDKEEKKKIIKIDVVPERGFYSEETIFSNRRMFVKMLISGKKYGWC